MENNKPPIIRMIICAAIAVAAVGFGVHNILFSEFNMLNYVFRFLLAAVGMTAIGEFYAALSKFPIISYVVSVVVCAVVFQIITPFGILPLADFYYMDEVIAAYQLEVIMCLAVYSLALTVSILVGIFVLHQKDIFKSSQS